ncbi:hypothetical protein TUM19329_30180 [Legionella antarctica]|uniref:Uncharacterized protein n=1 Tax=Legionella antarctica TaxID=2708020 RepID=A0A6F8T963_9GAMM|nr:hypothetical protein [Legionella antarctica]BCA96657.1 hypothetical protein TUM19329_30180 [Legionella antarctica]
MREHLSVDDKTIYFLNPPQDWLGALSKFSILAEKVTGIEDIHPLFEQKIQKKERFDGLIIALPELPKDNVAIMSMTVPDWDDKVMARLKQSFIAAQMAIDDYLYRGEGGKICFLAANSTAGYPLVLKSALHAFCRSIGKEYGQKNIYCNALYYPENSALIDEIIFYLLYLMSDEADFVTGDIFYA